MNTKMTVTHNRYTDICHADIADPSPNANIVVRELGGDFGYPGQILGRFDAETGELYALTFQRWSTIRRALMWRYRTFLVRNALDQLVVMVRDLCKKNGHHRVPALTH